MANRLHRNAAEIRYLIEALGEGVHEELSAGNSLNLGWCRIGLAMTGALDSANAPFGADNRLKITMNAAKSFSRVLSTLKPINDFEGEVPRILDVAQWSADLRGGRGDYTFGSNCSCLLTEEGPRRVLVNALYCNAREGVEDEGVWIEDMDGHLLLKGKIVESEMDFCNFELDGHLKPGDYRLVISARGRHPDGKVTHATRVVTVMPLPGRLR